MEKEADNETGIESLDSPSKAAKALMRLPKWILVGLILLACFGVPWFVSYSWKKHVEGERYNQILVGQAVLIVKIDSVKTIVEEAKSSLKKDIKASSDNTARAMISMSKYLVKWYKVNDKENNEMLMEHFDDVYYALVDKIELPDMQDSIHKEKLIIKATKK